MHHRLRRIQLLLPGSELLLPGHERAKVYEMPETEPDGFAEAYLHTPIQKIRTYSLAQFDHWTKDPFSSNFRKMLMLEQYRAPKLAQFHHDYLAGGPLEYMAAIFRKLADSNTEGEQILSETVIRTACPIMKGTLWVEL